MRIREQMERGRPVALIIDRPCCWQVVMESSVAWPRSRSFKFCPFCGEEIIKLLMSNKAVTSCPE